MGNKPEAVYLEHEAQPICLKQQPQVGFKPRKGIVQLPCTIPNSLHTPATLKVELHVKCADLPNYHFT